MDNTFWCGTTRSFVDHAWHLSPIKWAIGNLAPYTLAGVHFSCTEDQRLPNGQCPIRDGKDVLNLYNLDGNARLNLMAVGICVVVYRILAYLVLKARRTRWTWPDRLGRRRLYGEKDIGRLAGTAA